MSMTLVFRLHLRMLKSGLSIGPRAAEPLKIFGLHPVAKGHIYQLVTSKGFFRVMAFAAVAAGQRQTWKVTSFLSNGAQTSLSKCVYQPNHEADLL